MIHFKCKKPSISYLAKEKSYNYFHKILQMKTTRKTKKTGACTCFNILKIIHSLFIMLDSNPNQAIGVPISPFLQIFGHGYIRLSTDET